MDRSSWLAERRTAVEAGYTVDGPTYDDGYDPRTPTHVGFVEALVERTPPGGWVLDAACGTAPYAGIVLDAGRRYRGIDQSSGMLGRAREKWPDERFDRIGLQELAIDGDCHAAMCIDAMEHVPPEEWPLVLANLSRALRPGGSLYLTVEEIDRADVDDRSADARADGLPVLEGEVIVRSTGGYHFYPDRERVERWLTDAGFAILDQADEALDGYGYHHLLVRR
jgi:SAM-dependent methyltransferase